MRIKTALKILGRNGLAKAAEVKRQTTYTWLIIPYKYQKKVLQACKDKEKARKQALIEVNKMIKQLEKEHAFEQNQRSD